MLEFARMMVCGRCAHSFLLEADYELHYKMNIPKKCPNTVPCEGKVFLPATKAINIDLCRDYQEIQVQEQVSKEYHFFIIYPNL